MRNFITKKKIQVTAAAMAMAMANVVVAYPGDSVFTRFDNPLTTGQNFSGVSSPPSPRASILLGKEFTVAKMGVLYKDRDRNAMNAAAVDLLNLVVSLGIAQEAKVVTKLLHEMLNNEKSGAEAAALIETIFQTYAARQPVAEEWYTRLGAASASLVYSAFYEDETSLRSDSSKLAALLLEAPAAADAGMVASLKTLSSAIRTERITSEEMQRITKMGLDLFKEIEAKN